VDMREVVNGLMYVLTTGCQWRAIPKDLSPRSTVNGYFTLWDYDGYAGSHPSRALREVPGAGSPRRQPDCRDH